VGVTKAQHAAHGFRSSASKILNESGEFRADAIEAQLAHLDTRADSWIYNRAPLLGRARPDDAVGADMLDEARTSN
jgi:hypothetical protein